MPELSHDRGLKLQQQAQRHRELLEVKLEALAQLRDDDRRLAKEIEGERAAADPRLGSASLEGMLRERRTLQDRVREMEGDVARAHSALDDISATLADAAYDPARAAKSLDPDTPLLLMPLRLETRWFASELRVRFYPDEWAVNGFDPRLTDTEVTTTTAFWAAWFRAAGDESMRRDAWRALVASHGGGRAGWLVHAMRPGNEDDEPVRTSPSELVMVAAVPEDLNVAERAALVRYWSTWWASNGDDDAIVAAADALDVALGADRSMRCRAIPLVGAPAVVDATVAPTIACCVIVPPAASERAAAGRFVAANASVLPERITAIGYANGVEAFRVVGAPVPPSLALGPDSDTPESEQFRIENGELVVPDPLRWMVDFDVAERVGMAVRIPRRAPMANGFDRLVVIGLRSAFEPRC